MPIYAIGLNYTTTAIHLREKAYFPLDKLSLYLQDLLSQGLVEEAVLLSTCNRSELYCQTENIIGVKQWFSEQTTIPLTTLSSLLYLYKDVEAVAHMMRVACGLDSMVLGEAQILGQMKAAFSESCSVEAVGTPFHRLFQQIFSVAKIIRTTTAIGACPVSIASAAVYFARMKHPNFLRANIAVIGAGETAQLILRYLKNQNQNVLRIVNRDAEKAASAFKDINGIFYDLVSLSEVLQEVDIIFSATGSILPIVTSQTVSEIHKPLLFIDVALPRDIDEAVGKHHRLYCIDDLKNLIESHRQDREHAARKALEMIEVKSKACLNDIQHMDKVSYAIKMYRAQIEMLCRNELRKAKQQLKQGLNSEKVLTSFAHALINKLMHTPSVQLRQAGAEGRFELLHLVKQLFALPDREAEQHETID